MLNKSKKRLWQKFVIILFIALSCTYIAWPNEIKWQGNFLGKDLRVDLTKPPLNFSILGKKVYHQFNLKKGLDIAGGMEVVLQADMTAIESENRQTALESAKEIILRRIDAFGLSEPLVQTAVKKDDYRIIVNLPGVTNSQQALDLVGKTAQLDFRLQLATRSAQATQSAVAFLNSFEKTELTGDKLKKSSVQFDPQTNTPVVGLEFNQEGSKIFAEITKNNVDQVLAIFLDGTPIMMPKINSAILDGQAVISGDFTIQEAKQLSIQLNAGALPVPIKVLEQKNLGAFLGEKAMSQSLIAGLIGVFLICLFMNIVYGLNGFIANLSLFIYTVILISIYKIFGVVLTIPGIAGLILSIGMAGDANILIFERIKEEQRNGKNRTQAMKLGFKEAWSSIRDSNITLLLTALILINPLDFSFLNRSGLVRGFGITLFIGALVSLFTSITVTKLFMKIFYKENDESF